MVSSSHGESASSINPSDGSGSSGLSSGLSSGSSPGFSPGLSSGLSSGSSSQIGGHSGQVEQPAKLTNAKRALTLKIVNFFLIV